MPKFLFRDVSDTFCSRISIPAVLFLHGHSWHRKHSGKMSKVKKCRGLHFLSHHPAAGQASPKINVPCLYPHPSLASPGKYPGMRDEEPKFPHQLIPQHPRLQEGPGEFTHYSHFLPCLEQKKIVQKGLSSSPCDQGNNQRTSRALDSLLV